MTTAYSDKHLKEVWTAIFRRRGGAGKHTNVFEMLNQNDRDFLYENVNLHGDELPVIASIPRVGVWSLLTTKRLIWVHCEGELESMSLKELKDVRVDLRALADKGITKDRNKIVEVFSSKGMTSSFEVEPGRPLNGFLTVLMHARRLNSSHRAQGTGRNLDAG